MEAALAKYGIITENPWEKGVKCALPAPPARPPACLQPCDCKMSIVARG